MVTLSIIKRNAIGKLCADNIVFRISQLPSIQECINQNEYLKVYPEQLFFETIDIIDSIRELDFPDSGNYALSLYNKLVIENTGYANQLTKNCVDIKHKILVNEVESLSALTVYISACAILLSKSKHAAELYQNLISPLTSEQNRYFIKLFDKLASALSERQKTEWQKYYSSDAYISEDILAQFESMHRCMYIQPEKIMEVGVRTVEEYEEDLRIACEGSASVLVKFLKQGLQLGYLHFYSHNGKEVLINLQNSFPSMKRYTYSNFNAECKKEGLSFT